MNNPYLWLEPSDLAAIWGMRAAEMMPQVHELGETASAARDTAYMLLAGAMRAVRLEVHRPFAPGEPKPEADDALRERRVRFEVLKRAASLAIPDHPERWLMDAHANGLADLHSALESDDGLCELLRHLQQIAWIGGRWHTSAALREA